MNFLSKLKILLLWIIFIRKYETFHVQKLLDIPILLSIENENVNIFELLKLYFNEIINEWLTECINCKEFKTIHKKLIKFDRLGEVLFISLQRCNNLLHIKINSIVTYEEILNLKDLYNGNYNDNFCFKLKGVIKHYGILE